MTAEVWQPLKQLQPNSRTSGKWITHAPMRNIHTHRMGAARVPQMNSKELWPVILKLRGLEDTQRLREA